MRCDKIDALRIPLRVSDQRARGPELKRAALRSMATAVPGTAPPNGSLDFLELREVLAGFFLDDRVETVAV